MVHKLEYRQKVNANGIHTNNNMSAHSFGGGHNIRIYHVCEGRIEKYVPRIAFWHNEAYRVMTNDDPEGQIHTNNGFFFSRTTVFIYLF